MVDADVSSSLRRRPVRILFIHQNVPGQYRYIAARLAADRRHDVVVIRQAREEK